MTLLVDAHAHAWMRWPYEPAVPDAGSRGTPDQLLWEMDQEGVVAAALVAADIGDNPDNNGDVARWSEMSGGRLLTFASTECLWQSTYHRPGAAARLAAVMRRTRPAGLALYFGPETDDWPLSEDGLEFWRAVGDTGLPVALALPAVWQPRLREVARRFPGIPLILNHLGSFRTSRMPAEAALGEILATLALPNIHVKLSGTHYGAARPWEFPNTEALAAVRAMADVCGPERMVWGSDYPVLKRDRSFTYRQTVAFVRDCCDFFTRSERAGILGANFLRLLPADHAAAVRTAAQRLPTPEGG